MEYQLPNEHIRVSYLLEGIQCPDPGLQATMASIRTNDGPDCMRNNLRPQQPKKQAATGKHPAAQILAATAEDVEVFTSTTTKESIGKTGVHLQCHPTAEYCELTVEQKKQLHEWRSNNPGAKTGKHQKYNGKGGHNKKKSISATITREVKKAFTAQPKSFCGQHNNEPDDQATTDAENISQVWYMQWGPKCRLTVTKQSHPSLK